MTRGKQMICLCSWVLDFSKEVWNKRICLKVNLLILGSIWCTRFKNGLVYVCHCSNLPCLKSSSFTSDWHRALTGDSFHATCYIKENVFLSVSCTFTMATINRTNTLTQYNTGEKTSPHCVGMASFPHALRAGRAVWHFIY